MRKYLIPIVALFSAAAVYGAATRILTADQIRSSDRTKTWSCPSTTETLVGRATTDTLTNKIIAAGSNTVSGLTNTNLSGSAAIANGNLASVSNNTIKSNVSGSSGTPSDNTLTAILDAILGSTQGSVIYRAASAWLALPPGSSGSVFTSGGGSANPYWGAGGSGGGIGTEQSCTGVTLTGFGTSTPPTFTYCKYWAVGTGAIFIDALITNGDPNGVEARMALPASLTTKSDYPTLQACGTGVTDQADLTFIPLCEASKAYITFGKANSGTGGLVKQNGTAWATIGRKLSFQATVRVDGL